MMTGEAAWKAFCPSYASGYVAPVQAARDAQIQVVPEGLRFEVAFGDVYTNPAGQQYSDSRALISGPAEMWEDEGNERWYSWSAMWPVGWVGSFPKWDELFPGGHRSAAGSSIEWHHEPLVGGIESGSAPLYIGADDSRVWMTLIDQATSEVRKDLTLASLVLGHWYHFLFHFVWSSDPKKGLVEVWADGVQVVAPFNDQTMYPKTRMYPVAGLYRNWAIGDPSLKYPNGSPVYPAGDGTPGYMLSGGFARGNTRAEVDTVAIPPAPPAAPAVDPVKAKEGLALLIATKAQWDAEAAQLGAVVDSLLKLGPLLPPLVGPLVAARDAALAQSVAIGKLLDKGPW